MLIMLTIFALSMLASLLIAYVIVKYQYFYKFYSNDNDLKGVQKFHNKPVPRIGGLALMAGLLVSQPPFWLVLAMQPVFIAGLTED